MNKLIWAAILVIVFTIGWEVGHWMTIAIVSDLHCVDAGVAPQ